MEGSVLVKNLMWALEKLTAASFSLGVLATAGIFLATLYELVARYFFAAPTIWALDLSSYLLCVAVFFSLPSITAQGASISITILIDMLDLRHKSAITTAVEIIAGLSCLTVGALCVDFALGQYSSGILTLAVVPIPRWIMTAVMAYGFLLSAILHFQRALLGASTQDVAVL